MSDHAIQSCNDGYGTVGQSRRRPGPSAWMAHWSDTSCKAVGRASLSHEVNEDGRATKLRSLLSGPEMETNISYEQYDCKPLPIKPVKFHNFFEKGNLAASRSSKDIFVGSSSKDSTVLAKFKGTVSRELISLSHGVKLRLLGSSMDGEEKENCGHVKTSLLCLKNGSSVDADTMEMNALHENHLSGTTSSPSNKDVDRGQVSPSSQATLASSQEDTEQRQLDINQRLPEPLAIASPTDDRDTSSSRTQSLGVERLFSNPEHPEDSTPNASPDSLSGLDPSTRWIKRLKLSASGSFGHGTKNSTMPEVSCHEKGSNVFSTTRPKPLAHSWIRRWSHNQAKNNNQKSTEAGVVCEPESFDGTSGKFQNKVFPSIAAMAMMGKAMKRFRPCEFQKLGPSVVWNTEQF